MKEYDRKYSEKKNKNSFKILLLTCPIFYILINLCTEKYEWILKCIYYKLFFPKKFKFLGNNNSSTLE